ncbi:MAG TPA: DsbA family oxidoreductase [Acetobacteraceae bacterium]|jgi:predicted DsbA family dithiol-disulfide isomerase|nr:DsbA family oxidoreductase [Acetobacteraceae bacterium]
MDDLTPAGAVCGPDGCDISTEPETLNAQPGAGTRIDIVSDAICPWCYIGKRQMERALVSLAGEGLAFSIHWNPFQLNPDMPKEGRDRAQYRAWKFGSAEKAAALDARIVDAAAQVGLEFHPARIKRTPNTIDAHRLIWFAGQNGVQDAAMEQVFGAYFIEAQDIGDHGVLADCAAAAGLDRDQVMAFLAGDLADKQMRAADQAAREAGVSGVPSFFLDGYGLFSGAMPHESMANAFRQGNKLLRERAPA